MSKQQRESHKQARRQCLEDALGSEHSDVFKDKLVDKILHINDRFNGTPEWISEALNSGDGTYKP